MMLVFPFCIVVFEATVMRDAVKIQLTLGTSSQRVHCVTI